MKALEIINRSIADDPAAFRAALINHAETSDSVAHITQNYSASLGNKARVSACLSAYDSVGRGDGAAIVALGSTMIISLNIACKLQGLGPAIRTAAAVDWEEGRAA